MSESVLMAFCWVALGVTGLVFVGVAAIGAAYHPEQGLRNMAALLAPVVVIAGLLGLFPRTKGVVWLLVLIATAFAGVALVGFFAYRLAVDAGDALLWTPPLLLGLGMLALVVGLGRNAGKRGDL